MTDPSSPEAPAPLRQARVLAHVLDDLVRVPGTSWRVGLDPLLGLLPGLGDWLGWVAAGHLLVAGARMGAPAATLVRMAGNLLVDAAAGVLPLVGDLFDVSWRANARNLALLERHHLDAAATRRASRWTVAGVLGGTLAMLTATAAGGVWLLWRLLGVLP